MKNEIEDAGFFAGFDVGSSFVHYAILNRDRVVIYSPKPIMHFANPIGAVKEAWRDIKERFGRDKVKSTAFTGSGAETFPNIMRDLCIRQCCDTRACYQSESSVYFPHTKDLISLTCADNRQCNYSGTNWHEMRRSAIPSKSNAEAFEALYQSVETVLSRSG
jgi:hypothetical protein